MGRFKYEVFGFFAIRVLCAHLPRCQCTLLVTGEIGRGAIWVFWRFAHGPNVRVHAFVCVYVYIYNIHIDI